MDLARRHHVTVKGEGPATLVFSHGFGCDQNMWRFLAPRYQSRYRCVLFDLGGAGRSDLQAWNARKYASLDGHADDLLELLRAFAVGPVIFIGHSVSAMIGLIAANLSPATVAAHVMIGPSPRYIDDGDYLGGFGEQDVDALLQTLDSNYLGWAGNMAPSIMGSTATPGLADDLASSFCRTDPEIAKHFARVIFTSDHRDELPKLAAPALVIQSAEDFIAPPHVGDFIARTLPHGTLRIIDNVGHLPHVSAPDESAEAIDEFLQLQGF
ncbi:alpha/beta hydrolase [soil metagenome]